MSAVKIIPKKLKGSIIAPPSKSLSHRYIIAASLSDDISVIKNVLLSKDIIATTDAMISLGASISFENQMNSDLKTFVINGNSTLKLEKNLNIDVNESGSTLRFLIPITLLSKKLVTFQGKGKLPERPLNVFFDMFNKKNIKYTKKGIYNLPLEINGPLVPGYFYLEGNISSQFISGLLFALPILNGDSKIYLNSKLESRPYIDLTLSVLKEFGINILNNNYESFEIKGRQKYISTKSTVESDFSQAAFWLVANQIGSNINIECLNLNSLQGDKAIINIIEKYKFTKNLVEIDVSEFPDLVPILAVLASFSNVNTRIYNASRVRIKECDRLSAIRTELNKIGANITEFGDELHISPVQYFTGGISNSHNDHRIAMALSIASTRCINDLIIEDSDSINKSYPNFFEDFKNIGGDLIEYDMGK